MNVLIDACKNGEKGYREDAEGINNAYFQMRLNEYARHRALFASELQALVRRLGGDPDRKGTVAGSLHRGWMNLKAAIAGRNDDAILAECCRGEEAALRHFEEAFMLDLPPAVHAAVENQRNTIKESIEHLKAMESHA
ncbi:MAG TPA: PA2169 family four-helix-bundle protein [Acidobacteriota bacterium]|nr:PA2169 family four-helix-bundle protein [Acidobacteriota bacterium]